MDRKAEMSANEFACTFDIGMYFSFGMDWETCILLSIMRGFLRGRDICRKGKKYCQCG